MPFTLAHPAAVVPFHRRLGRSVPLSSLVVGSIAPDLAYFLPLGIRGSYSHSIPGLFLFCLPVGVVAWVIYLIILRPFFLVLLPRPVSERLGPSALAKLSLPTGCAAAAAVLLGATTHLVWDSFTHGSGFVVEASPALRTPLHLFGGYSPRLFTVLQHASTLGGLTILAVLGLRWFRSTRPKNAPRPSPLSLWPRLVVLCALLLPSSASGYGVLRRHLADGQPLLPLLQNYLGLAVFSAGTVFLGMVLLLAILWRAWETWRGQPGTGS